MPSIKFRYFLRFYVSNQSFRICLENYHNCCGRRSIVVGRHRRRDRFYLSNITVHVSVLRTVDDDDNKCVCAYVYISLRLGVRMIYLRMQYTQLRALILHFNSFRVENSLFAFKSHYNFNFNFQHVFSHNNSCFFFFEWYDLQTKMRI